MNLKWRGKMTLANDVLKNAAFEAKFNVIMTSQNNVKSNARYAMTSIFARSPVIGISKSHVLTARAHENCNFKTWRSLKKCAERVITLGLASIRARHLTDRETELGFGV